VKDVQAFLRLMNYYRRFVYTFRDVAAPLNNLTKKDVVFAFRANYREAFKELKQRLLASDVLRIHDPELENILETNALDLVIATILT
jgi:hypothetical protein